METHRGISLSPGLVTSSSRSRSIARGITIATIIAGLTWVGANIYIPLNPVPITLQTLFVLLAGSVGGRLWGTAGQAIYVGVGAVGLPVFAGSTSGLGIIAGPTGGFLMAFLVVPVVIATLLRSSETLLSQVLVFALGTAIIFAAGIAHLTLFYTHNLNAALAVGLVPFIPGAIIKIVAAVSIHRSYHALVKQRHTGRR